MRHWITDDSEITGNWLDEYIEELTEHLYAIAETNRLANLVKGKIKRQQNSLKSSYKFRNNECKELLIELIYVIFEDRKELNKFYEQYHEYVKEDEL